MYTDFTPMTRLAAVLIAGTVCAAGQVTLAHDGHDGPTGRTFTVGRNGAVNIREDVKVGAEAVVRRGTYLFEHRVDGDRHLILLTGISKKGQPGAVYELSTQPFPARDAARRSVLVARELSDHSLQIAIIHVAGEALEHAPDGLTLRAAEAILTKNSAELQ